LREGTSRDLASNTDGVEVVPAIRQGFNRVHDALVGTYIDAFYLKTHVIQEVTEWTGTGGFRGILRKLK
jgi:hypothetical protein